ncbi:MAG: hypothetical protein H7Z39_14310, partial [Burkholderiaceae bacterium]|nr:hypothetical protein [Burkholderiaceae bacterium]
MQFARTALTISVFLSGLVFAQPVAEPGAVVEAFTPKGEVKGVRQVAARFSEPMVAFGDPRLESPFEVRCDAKGQGHWADVRNWVYDFDADLPAGLKCNFSTRAKLKAMSGKDVTAASFDFSTGGPAILKSWPGDGSESIDEDQAFLLGLDAVADLASVREHAYCSVSGLGERVPLQIVEGKERERILAEQKGKARDLFLVLTKRARLGLLGVKNKRLDDAALVVVARCARKLVADSKVDIVWDAGIRTAAGIATSAAQTLHFKVREQFSAKSSCERVNPKAGCIPILPISLNFTAPVDAATAALIELRGADGKVVRPTLREREEIVNGVRFDGPFAPLSEVTITLPARFQDDAKRALVNAASFPLKIRIDDDPPLIKFPSHFGILEANAQPALPVSVRNVEATLKGLQVKVAAQLASNGDGELAKIDASDDQSIAKWLNRVLVPPHENDEQQRAFEAKHKRNLREGELPILFGKKAADAKSTPLNLPRADGAKTFELMGIPLPSPGFYVVEFASQRLGQALHAENKPYYAYSSALVTNMGVHFKLGRESSLAWVTQLDNAKPVKGAQVSAATCDGKHLWNGKTDADGVVRIDEHLPTDYYGDHCFGLLIVARKDRDMSFALTRWNDGLSPWEFNLGGGSTAQPVIVHTVFDRPLFRAGETVSMKHFLRARAGAGFEGVKVEQSPGKATLTHNGSGQSYEMPIRWHAGAGVSEWAIPKEAKLGSYAVSLALSDGERQSGTFRVEQYRVPLMKAVLKPPAKPLVRATNVDIDAQLSYLSGGVAAGAPVKFRSRLVAFPLHYPDYDDFHFGGKAPKEGIEAVAPYSYDPEADDGEGGDADAADVPAGVAGYPVRTVSKTLDASGGARINFAGLPRADEPRALEVEMEYTDPNGQIMTSATRALVLPSALVLGMRIDGGFATKEKMSFKVLALDARGRPQIGRKVGVTAYQRKTYSYRKRLLGGFYAYEQTAEVKRLGELCGGKTDDHGLLLCVGEAPETGQLMLVATAKDDDGNVAQASSELYVADSDNWYAASQNDRIDVLPERREYKPGETARFEVRMPFREATALVTVEREGVLYSSVVPISAKSPFVEVPIAKNFGPNTYVSVMVVRGRVDPESGGRYSWLRRMINRIGVFFGLAKKLPPEIDTHPTALVDLTKPAFKLGIAQIRVGWDAYELKVKVEADKPVYKIRDRAMVKIHVSDAAGKPAANAEIALAAVDEGLLSLAAPTSWKLLEAMMERRPEEVTTSTAQSQVIGKRHFGKKAAAPGGGGGEGANARELFDTLLLWKPVVQLDANGDARVEVPLNDSLTAFRIAAIAHAGDMQFGSATATIRTTQEVMLFAGLPPFVREGDQFAAMVTVRNGGERPLTLDVSAGMTAGAGMAEKPVGKQRVSLNAGEASTLSFPASVPFDSAKLNWNILATEVMTPAQPNLKPARDALKFVQSVGAAYPVRLYQQTLEQLEPGKALGFPVQKPAGAIPGRGGVEVRLVNSLGGELGGLREWMTRYPYTCLEQRASVAVALEDPARWRGVMNSLPSFLDRDGLARYFPMGWLEGDDALTAYILTIANEAGYEVPEAARNRMLRGLENFVTGR